MLHLARKCLFAALACVVSASAAASFCGLSEVAQQPPAAPATQPKTDAQKRDRIAEIIANAVDQAHGGVHFRQNAVLRCTIELECGETKRSGVLAFEINGRAARLDLSDGTSIVFDGSSSTSKNNDSAPLSRVQLMTWRNLVCSPFMANDRAFKVSAFKAAMVMGADADAFSVAVTLPENQKASLMAYADARSHQLSVIGGDNLGTLLGLSDAQPVRCVVFRDLQTIDEAIVPTTWWLYDWSEASSVRGSQLGTVKLSKIEFVTADSVSFASVAPAEPARPNVP